MAQDQLKRAAALIKQGEKGQAGQILRGILREDKHNTSAWWLLSLVTDDKEKSIRMLEKVISLEPNHKGANARLAKLQATTVSDDPFAEFNSLGSGSATSLPEKPKNAPPTTRTSKPLWQQILGNSLVLRLGLIAIFAIGAGLYTVIKDSNVEDINGNTPRDIIWAFEEAYWNENYDTAAKLVCPGYDSYLQEQWSGSYLAMDGQVPPDLTVDMSGVRMERIRSQLDAATYGFHGMVRWTAYGEQLSYSYDDDIASQGGDVWIGHHVRRINGVWMICDGPDTIYQ